MHRGVAARLLHAGFELEDRGVVLAQNRQDIGDADVGRGQGLVLVLRGLEPGQGFGVFLLLEEGLAQIPGRHLGSRTLRIREGLREFGLALGPLAQPKQGDAEIVPRVHVVGIGDEGLLRGVDRLLEVGVAAARIVRLALVGELRVRDAHALQIEGVVRILLERGLDFDQGAIGETVPQHPDPGAEADLRGRILGQGQRAHGQKCGKGESVFQHEGSFWHIACPLETSPCGDSSGRSALERRPIAPRRHRGHPGLGGGEISRGHGTGHGIDAL